MRKRVLRRSRPDQQDEQLHLALGDLFASMVGVIMLFVLYLLILTPGRTLIQKSKKPFNEWVAGEIVIVESLAGGYAEAVYVNPDHLLVPQLGNKEIPVDEIMTDKELEEYLRRLYIGPNGHDGGGQALMMLSSGSYQTQKKLEDLLYRLGREDERFLYYQMLFIHDNLDFILDEELKQQYRQEWGLEE